MQKMDLKIEENWFEERFSLKNVLVSFTHDSNGIDFMFFILDVLF